MDRIQDAVHIIWSVGLHASGLLQLERTEWAGAACFPCVQAADDMTTMQTGKDLQDCADKMQHVIKKIDDGGI